MSAPAVVVRKMVQQDLSAVLAILEAWNMAPRAPSQGSLDPERSEIRIENSFVALVGGSIVGVASFIVHSADTAETASLAVDPAFKGQGIGKKLQLARLEEMKSRGIRKVRTETDRPETIRWYIEKFGYHITGTNPKKHNFSLNDVDHWTVLEREL
jgi:N-acetylglutamate synthase-like GNAT family acetyltransferase